MSDRPCCECEAVLPLAKTWPWTGGRRICVPCLEAIDRPRPAKKPSGPTCAYCGSHDDVAPCCVSHPGTGMCRWCRAVPGRPLYHRSPIEGRACCGTTKDSNPGCDICGRINQRRKAKR